MSRLPDGWHSSESRRNGAVDSEQRALSPEPVVAPTLEGAQRLGHEYWRAVMRSTLGLVRPRESRGGVELRVLGLPPALLVLEPANVAVAHDRVACTFRIVSGVLARRAGGTLTLTQVGLETAELRVAVKGFHPRLGLLYAPLEQRLHASVSRRYLAGGTW
jgi:hypothetical protein